LEAFDPLSPLLFVLTESVAIDPEAIAEASSKKEMDSLALDPLMPLPFFVASFN